MNQDKSSKFLTNISNSSKNIVLQLFFQSLFSQRLLNNQRNYNNKKFSYKHFGYSLEIISQTNMLNQEQLRALVRQNLHLFRSQLQVQHVSPLKFAEMMQEDENSKNLEKQTHNLDQLKLNLWKANESLIHKENVKKCNLQQQYIGPILSYQRRQIWSKNEKENKRANSMTISFKKNQNAQENITNQRLFSTVKNYAINNSKKTSPHRNDFSQNQNLYQRKNRLFQTTINQQKPRKSVQRRYKIFSLSTKQDNKSINESIKRQNSQKKISNTQKSINQQNRPNKTQQNVLKQRIQQQNEEQTINLTMQKAHAEEQKRYQEIIKVIKQTQYLPSPQELISMLMGMSKNAFHTKNSKYDKRSSIRQNMHRKRVDNAIYFNEKSTYSSIPNTKQTRNQFIPPHPEVFQPSHLIKYHYQVTKNPKVNFNYTNSTNLN